MVCQFSRDASRVEPDRICGALCPRMSPAMTTASTPEPWIASAGM